MTRFSGNWTGPSLLSTQFDAHIPSYEGVEVVDHQRPRLISAPQLGIDLLSASVEAWEVWMDEDSLTNSG